MYGLIGKPYSVAIVQLKWHSLQTFAVFKRTTREIWRHRGVKGNMAFLSVGCAIALICSDTPIRLRCPTVTRYNILNYPGGTEASGGNFRGSIESLLISLLNLLLFLFLLLSSPYYFFSFSLLSSIALYTHWTVYFTTPAFSSSTTL